MPHRKKDSKAETPRKVTLVGEQGSLTALANDLTTLVQVRGDNRRLVVEIDTETLEVSEKDEHNG